MFYTLMLLMHALASFCALSFTINTHTTSRFYKPTILKFNFPLILAKKIATYPALFMFVLSLTVLPSWIVKNVWY